MIIAVFVFVAAFTSVQLVNARVEQADEVGELRLDGIMKELQDSLNDARASLEKIAEGAEMLIDSGASMDAMDRYIRAQKSEQLLKSDGTNFNTYIAGKGWEIIPDFDMPEDYHATERNWYVGAIDSNGRIYVTEPYIDSMTGQMCFTMSKMLEDKETVVSMDFTLSEVQSSIAKMMADKEYKALIVTREGMVVGYSDMSVVGSRASTTLPQYSILLRQVFSSSRHDRFTEDIDGNACSVFSSETNNGWYLVLIVDNDLLYGNTYREIAIILLVYLVLLALIIYFYIVSAKKRMAAEDALEANNDFLSGISEELTNPLKNIIKLSDSDRINNSVDVKEDMSSIRESGLILTQKLDNLLSYSYIASEEKKKHTDKRRKERDISKTIRKSRKFIVIIFTITMLLNIVVNCFWGYVSGTQTMSLDMDIYIMKLISWKSQQINILGMFTNVIEADPSILDDYDRCVSWLDAVASNYDDISVCYIANPYKEPSVFMNNRWIPDSDWRVEDRQWYKDTLKSDTGYSISAPYIDEQTNSYGVTFSRVVYGKNQEFLGVFGIDFFMDKLINIFGEGYSDKEYAFLADSNGVILNHPNSAYQMTAKTTVNVADTEYKSMPDTLAHVGFKDYNGKLSTGIMFTDSETGFSIYIVSEWWNVFGYYMAIMAFSVAMLIVCIVIVLFMINKIIHWQNDVNNKLAESVKRADAAGKAKSQFLAQMSHEIRTPINAVIGMDEMILRSTDDPVIKEYAGNINSAGKTLLELVNGILDFSKIEEGKMEIVAVKYSVVEMITDLHNMIAEKASAKGLELIFDIDPELPSSLFGDDVRMKQIILNILTNAVKYTEQGSVTLKITGVSPSDDEYVLHVSVKDTGIGIREEDMDRLFTSFQRLDVEKNRNIEGTGLGISIVQGLLGMMGSKLQVESIYGKGSEFFFEVSQKIIDKTSIGDYMIKSTENAGGTVDKLVIKDAEILVVDDNDMNLKVAKGLLKIYGVTPDLAASGKESIKMASRKRYDLIFMDHMMPGMDGVEALKVLVKEELVYDTPVICLTANAVAGMRDMYLAAGFNDYLSKPIEMKELENILVTYLPADKISRVADTPVNDAADGDMRPMEQLRAAGFDTAAGIEYSAGSEEFYIDMLRTFAQGYDEKSREIKKDYDDDDTDTYRIHVHALKSTAKMIGVKGLSELALAQETAAKEGRKDDITKGFGPLMKKYEETVSAIRKALPEE